jgi:hypothetical protein
MSDANKWGKDFLVYVAQDGGESLMSRSEAKFLLKPAHGFQTVTLDFSGVEYIGQGFADEIFRVFAKAHPGIELVPINTNPDVQKMISRAFHHSDS